MSILEYTFFQNALLGSLLASILCRFVGTYIVSSRLVFISGGITHICCFLTSGFLPDLSSYLFGSILDIGTSDLILFGVISHLRNVPSGASFIFVSILIYALLKWTHTIVIKHHIEIEPAF